MKPDYKNWMPKGMVLGALAGTLVCLVLFIILGCTGLVSGTAKTVLFVVFLAATVVCACVTLWMALMYRAFDYNGRRKMSKQIIEGIAEYVNNVSFRQGDATKLGFADGTFDAVTSNYVYHNIPSKDRQAILLETLRTLKKGGTFALHDIFSKSKYGDMQAFVKKLKDMGYEKVDLIDTTSGRFMTPFEAKWMGLSGSALLVGRK